MAERMLAEDPALRAAFQKWQTEGAARSASQKVRRPDEAFEQGPDARLQWFYERTPFFDDRALLYPIARELP
jgi:hypothetical protein